MTNGPTPASVHPYRSSSCRNNLQQAVAPRLQGPWFPSPSRTGLLGAPPLRAIPTLVREYLLDTSGSWASFSSRCQPRVRVVPFVEWPVLGSLWYGLPLSGGRRPLTHSPRRKVVSGPATPRVPTPRLLGVAERLCCFGPSLTNGGVVYAVVPCGP